MSHHLDTPLAAQTGQLLIDDLYVFPSEGRTVFVLDVNSDVNGLHSEPGFHPEARYELKIHVDGAEYEDLTYRVSFGEPDSAGQQPLKLRRVPDDVAHLLARRHGVHQPGEHPPPVAGPSTEGGHMAGQATPRLSEDDYR
jgi:Domain of unknown function (DUF4331)